MSDQVHVDLRWLLEEQTKCLPGRPEVWDFSALVAAVARHKVDPPRIGVLPDAAWRAAALFMTIVNERPLPTDNSFYACNCAITYMDQSGEGIDAPYGGLVDLAKDLRAERADIYDCADRIRSWRV